MLSLERVGERIYCLRIKDPYELAMMFFRYQEFYESTNPRMRERGFTWASYMSWYVRSRKTGLFAYPTDWAGFNIPVDVIRKVQEAGIRDPNHYDSLMDGVAGLIEAQEDGRAYLIGVPEGGAVDEHELAHAAFYVDDVYAAGCQSAFRSLPAELQRSLIAAMEEAGYPEKTAVDELQAYVNTGEHPVMKKFRSKAMEGFRHKVKELFRTRSQAVPVKATAQE